MRASRTRTKLHLTVETLRALIPRELAAIVGGAGTSGLRCPSGEGRDCPSYPHVGCPSYYASECEYNCAR